MPHVAAETGVTYVESQAADIPNHEERDPD